MVEEGDGVGERERLGESQSETIRRPAERELRVWREGNDGFRGDVASLEDFEEKRRA